jgi:hypothetical protein
MGQFTQVIRSRSTEMHDKHRQRMNILASLRLLENDVRKLSESLELHRTTGPIITNGYDIKPSLIADRERDLAKAQDNLNYLLDQLRQLDQETGIYYVYAADRRRSDFGGWMGTATEETIARLGSNVRVGYWVGCAPVDKYPSGWGYRDPAVMPDLN